MIALRDVCKTWDGGKSFAVKDLSLSIEQGEVLALLGGSGSGKSTTVKMINRLIEPSSGVIEIDGENVIEQDPVQLRRRIGYVFQSIGLFPHMTILENVNILPKMLGQDPAAYKEKGSRLLDMVELPAAQYADRYPHQLSGGQRQRVGFARALAVDPKVMLLDEPFGALDPVTRDSLQAEFLRLQGELGFTAVIVTHDMAEALLLADKIAVMKDGKLLRFGTPRELLQDAGDEYVAQLLETPRRHGRLIHDLETT
ncbi:ATP-binding cassette domain-containing protein [Blastopirellula sp. JC732]|uniref:ATP-binding cassette domain-containing protein n=1 Tax=Blastopirellula sediminis TaxID=2894196 RepID=A0A9X1SFY1_9BACT|nr:ATP-binding cassette domain-containing protein [Blastopirellula sediminis]MCC9608906.1 ATP-binding cassette domain-containing protein [Blastopirellula sediminis]MCC9628317.1 ATP-binding cassette domain-containing protein [Blastopirellula sediminis]